MASQKSGELKSGDRSVTSSLQFSDAETAAPQGKPALVDPAPHGSRVAQFKGAARTHWENRSADAALRTGN